MAVSSFQSFNTLNASGRSFFSIGRRCAGRRRRGADAFRGDDGLAAGTSDDPMGLAVFCDNRGCHAGQGPLSRRGLSGGMKAKKKNNNESPGPNVLGGIEFSSLH